MTVVLTLVGTGGLWLFAREINASIAVGQAGASDFAARARARGESFTGAAIEFEKRSLHEGLHIYAVPAQARRPATFGGPPPGGERPGGDRPPPGAGPPGGDRPPFGEPGPQPDRLTAIVDGVVTPNFSMRNRFEGNRFGFAVATLFGVRPHPPEPFLDGLLWFQADAQLFGEIALGLLGAVFAVAAIVGVLAGLLGRYITQQAIQPLIDVTEALQRFAARDFRAQPIAVAGRSDFDVLAHAYNAASAQVAASFAERDAAEAQMRQFVADAGHELRTPLTIILGYIDLLKRRVGANDDRSQFIFSSVASEGRRMRTLVDNLVLLAKLEGDDVRPVEPFVLADLIAEIADVRRGLDPSVTFALDLRAPVAVIADRSEVYEALANLIDNAIKYAPGSPIRITVDAPRSGVADIAVADDGPGIAVQDRSAIFERFFRGVGRGDVGGSGLGLAIAKRAIERAGGTIVLDETVARGTRFLITLRAERIAGRTMQTAG